MKDIFKRSILFLGRLNVAAHHGQPAEFQFPLPRVIGVASFVCFVSLILIYWVARPVVELFNSWWAELLVYGIIPTLAAFVILYRSSWHREMTGAARTGSLLLLSCVILGCSLIVIGASVFVVLICGDAIQARAGGR
jgi:ABC-type iron transport system FetAB permease component